MNPHPQTPTKRLRFAKKENVAFWEDQYNIQSNHGMREYD